MNEIFTDRRLLGCFCVLILLGVLDAVLTLRRETEITQEISLVWFREKVEGNTKRIERMESFLIERGLEKLIQDDN